MALTLSEEDFAEIEKRMRTVLMTAPAAAARPAQAAGGGAGGAVVPFGRDKGKPLYQAETKDVEYIANAMRRDIPDPAKARWVDNNEVMLIACEAELAHRGFAVAKPYVKGAAKGRPAATRAPEPEPSSQQEEEETPF